MKAGEVFAVTGLSNTLASGYIISKDYDDKYIDYLAKNTQYEMIPTLKSKVIFEDSTNIKDVLSAFNILDNEEPALNVVWEEGLKEIHIHVMGKIQLEIVII